MNILYCTVLYYTVLYIICNTAVYYNRYDVLYITIQGQRKEKENEHQENWTGNW